MLTHATLPTPMGALPRLLLNKSALPREKRKDTLYLLLIGCSKIKRIT